MNERTKQTLYRFFGVLAAALLPVLYDVLTAPVVDFRKGAIALAAAAVLAAEKFLTFPPELVLATPAPHPAAAAGAADVSSTGIGGSGSIDAVMLAAGAETPLHRTTIVHATVDQVHRAAKTGAPAAAAAAEHVGLVEPAGFFGGMKVGEPIDSLADFNPPAELPTSPPPPPVPPRLPPGAPSAGP